MIKLPTNADFFNAFNYLFRLNKRISDGVVTAYFIFPAGFRVDYNKIDDYAIIKKITEDANGLGMIIEFRTNELSDYFWNNWHCNYKFETND